MTAYAYFAGGCFWCIDPVFAGTEGVESVVCGYSGGEEKDPTYEQVKSQRTGHRETIRIGYDPARVAYGALLEIFLRSVDPFDGEGQFIDRGRSYTLAVYYLEEEEKAEAEKQLRALEEEYGRKAFVSVEPFGAFYEAEEYHQDYYLKNPEAFAQEIRESGRADRSPDGTGFFCRMRS